MAWKNINIAPPPSQHHSIRRHYCSNDSPFSPIQQLHSIGQHRGHLNFLRRTKRSTTTSTSTAIHFGLEDLIFNAENIGFSHANTVLNNPSYSSSSSSSSSLGIPSSSSDATATTISLLFSFLASIKSLLILYAAGIITSFSPCSLGLLPITISYISNAANERTDKNTILPTCAYAVGLAVVFTTLGVSASVLGSVFGSSSSSSVSFEGGGSESLLPYLLATISPLVSVLMGLQLLELIRIPLPSLDFKWRNAVILESSGGVLGAAASSSKTAGSLFDANGGLILDNNTSMNINDEYDDDDDDDQCTDPNESNTDEVAALVRMFLLGGTSALVASPCATPVLASLLAYLASASLSSSSPEEVQTLGNVWNGASWMLSYTLGYSTLLVVAGATGGQALVNLRKARDNSVLGGLWQWITPLTGGVLIAFGMNGLLVALLGDPSLSALAPILE